jgi:transcriptional regulator with XRE-family HTH domain
MEIFTKKLGMVRIARQQKGLTLAEVVAQLPTRKGKRRSIQFLHRIELGKSARVDRGIAEALSRVLDADISELFTEVDR